MKKKATRPSGIKEIARKLGVSIGTVDRALHNRSGISKKTRTAILAAAEQMHYRPNLAARNLKLNMKLRIAVCLPEEIAWFFDPLREGIRAGARQAAGIAVDLDFRSYPRIGDGDAALVGSLEKGYDAALITPGNPAEFEPLITRLAELGTAVFCVASDAPGSPRVASVRADAEVCGGIAAELLAKALGNRGTVAAITGDLSTYDHAEKLRGFTQALATSAPRIKVLPAIETYDRPLDARRATLDLLQRVPEVEGLYISTANCTGVIDALRKQKRLGKIEIVATDLSPEIAALIESGVIFASIYQRPFTQGLLVIEEAIRALQGEQIQEAQKRLAPHIVLRSNLRLFPNQQEHG
jgi:LacI family transcriptional regulator